MTILGIIPLDTDTTAANLWDSGGGTISAGNGRLGGNSTRLNSGSTATKNIGSNIATMSVAFAYNNSAMTGSGTLLSFLDAGTLQCNLKGLADGTLQVLRNNTTLLGSSAVGVINSGVQNHIEVMMTISPTVGTVDVWVNSTNVLSLTGQNTRQTANSTVSGFLIQEGYTATGDFSDIIWANARITDLHLETVVPTGAGNYTQFTPSAGSNWQNVDEVPPNGDTDYNETATLNNIDTFTHGALVNAPTSIKAVIVCHRARNTVAGAGSVADFLRSGTTDAVGNAVAHSTSYSNGQTVWETDPATGAAWASIAAVNATEIGYKKTV